MKSNFKIGARCVVWLALVLLALGACGKASSSSGSNSNWLKPCSVPGDCDPGFECWCHVCAAPCGDPAACDQPSARCASGAAVGCGEVPKNEPICVASCDSLADCQAFGPEFSCVNDACVVVTDDGPSVGGSSSGNAGGSGGSEAWPRGDVGTIAVGDSQRCVATAGRLYCWGNNLRGQVGGDPASDAQEIRLLPEVSDVMELAAGNFHTCALTGGGDVYCWGYNASGEVGSESAPENTCPDYVLDRGGDYPCQPRPTRVAAVAGARHVAVGDGRSCAVLADDSVECWGDVGDIAEWAAAIKAPRGLALGPSGACAITPEGTLSCSREPPETTALTDLQALALSQARDEAFGCVLGTAGNVHCWGDDRYGQLGRPDAAGSLTNPINDASQIVVSGASACALMADGSVWCWGRNSSGEAGLAPLASPNCGFETCESSPRRVENLPQVTQLAAGGALTCAAAEDGAVWCWGADYYRTGGIPQRVPGPWEAGEAASVAGANAARRALREALFANNSHPCTTDQDCTRVSLDLPCLHSCETMPVSKLDHATLASQLGELSRTHCTTPEASCAPHRADCAANDDQDVCVQGTCTRVNLETSGCKDACSCLAERSASFGVLQGDCAGPDLWVVLGLDCQRCGKGGAWFVIGNRGDSRFSGSAVLSFEPGSPEETGPLPLPQSLELTLEPGQLTPALYVESADKAHARTRITGPGDCEPLNDDSSEVTFPAPQSCP